MVNWLIKSIINDEHLLDGVDSDMDLYLSRYNISISSYNIAVFQRCYPARKHLNLILQKVSGSKIS